MQYAMGATTQDTPKACLVDLTPPTFSGIAALSAEPNGSLEVSWLAASDISTPIRYQVYVQANTATGLFSDNNVALITFGLSAKIFQLQNATVLQAGTTYYVGVRALDVVGNMDTNTASLFDVSNGVVEDDLASIVADLVDLRSDLTTEVDDLQTATASIENTANALSDAASDFQKADLVVDVNEDENIGVEIQNEEQV